MSLTLSLRQAPPGRISLFGITPDRLAGRSIADIERLPLAWGRDTPALGEFFKASGSADDHLVFEGGDRRFCDLGGGMSSGECELNGDAGDFLGRDMRGGCIKVRGSAGRFAASGLAGGEVHIGGDAGDRLGAALPWLPGGMRGGRVVVAGSVGERCGDKMRRGEIFVGGGAGAFCATRMVAGSIIVAGPLGPHAGYGMRRGSLLLLGKTCELPCTFAETAMAADNYLQLVWRDWLARFDPSSAFAAFAKKAKDQPIRARRWMGDIGSDGRGEVIGFGG
jgi:formylmethanofuran dehydrogenase subunit C